MKAFIIRLIIVLILTAVCGLIGYNVTLTQQLETAEMIRNFAAIIFGVMGAWIAIVYPTDLQRLFKQDDAEHHSEKIASLTKPAIYSCLALTYTITLQIFSPAAGQFSALQGYKHILLAMNYAILGLLSILLLWSLIACFAKLIGAKEQVDAIRERQEDERSRRCFTNKDP